MRALLALALALLALLTMAPTVQAAAPDVPLTGPYVPIPEPVPGQIVAGRPFNAWPMCASESDDGRGCRWDARLMGNGRGRSFVVTFGGRVHWVKLAPVPARGTLAYFPQCKGPNGSGPGRVCWYSANTRGDGLGADYYLTSTGVRRYLPYQMIVS